jgi:hypothetical protein
VHRGKLRNVVVLSLPTIIGTGFFLAGAILSEFEYFRSAPPISWEHQPSVLERLEIGVEVTVFFACYFGAAFGPLALPLAGLEAFALTRAGGVRSSAAIWAWAFVVVGFVATALFWGWLAHLDLFI